MPFDHVDIYAPFPKQTIEIQMAYVRWRDGAIYAFQPRGPERGGLAGTWYGPIPDAETAQRVADGLNTATLAIIRDAGFKVVPDGQLAFGGCEFDKATVRGE